MHFLKYISFTLLFFTLIFFGCSKSSKNLDLRPQNDKIQNESLYGIKNVNIIPMTKDNKLIKNATIVIKGDKILSIKQFLLTVKLLMEKENGWCQV